ncbi:signal peptidase [Erythrobacter longus]|uniref:Signal peptidase I n=1 Tax=Erythrobacter longus TaxID=1044 RepID=A0A074M8R8_ERYLO|nr:signal peptidase I [Erythrobacter longus]KEO91171.1 signal peptidase [Erythrobacter longus]
MDGKAHRQQSASDAALGSSEDGANTSARPVKKETPKSFTIFLLQLLVAVLIFRSFIFAPFSIPSESMLPRLMNGDLLLAAKWPYGFSKHSLPFNAPIIPGRVLEGEPTRGDIVIFKHPVDGVDYVKRVIALPGDRVAIEDGAVILNGAPLTREPLSDFAIELSPNTGCAWGGREERGAQAELLCRYTQYRETLPSGRSYNTLDFGLTPGDDFTATTIPEGHMFVMGDSRDNSRDSRFAARSGDAVGIVSQDLLVGEAAIILWSSDGSAVWYNPVSWFSTVRWGRIGTLL